MTEGKLEDKVVIITGGTSGIGRAATLLFCMEGAKVIIGARNEDAAEEVIRQIENDGRGKAHFVKTDVSQPEQVQFLVESAVDLYGRLDVLYANSGIVVHGSAQDTSISDWQKIMAVNLGGTFFLAKYGIPHLIDSGSGTIIITASELGMVGARNTVAYCAAKGALINMTRAIAVDCGPLGIRVNCLAPGPIDTPMLRGSIDASENKEEFEASQFDPVLLGRFGTPEEIAEIALFLASDSSSFMTGSLLVADGGSTAWYGV